jgi:hypothetical protein
MIFNSKQLEELENIHDSTGAFEEEGDEEGGFDEVGEAAMDWRRGLIEEAAENIKRAKGRPVESHLTYPIGSMLFEREARRFARVQRSVPGYLKIVYLSGGDREFGTLDVVGYLRDYGAEKRLSELAEQLGMAEGDVANELERLGITPVEEPETEGEVAAEAATPEIPPPPVPAVRGKRAPVVEEEDESEEDEAVEDEVEEASDEDEVVADDDSDDSDEGEPVVKGKGKAKTAPPPPPKGKAAVAARADKAEKAEKPADKARAAAPAPAPAAVPSSKAAAAKAARAEKAEKVPEPKGKAAAKGAKAINPIDDPNGYIKANFQEMSNRELARFTGLSEHTIRRKLGEWGLKRKAP